MAQVIPVDSSTDDYVITVSLDAKTFDLRLRWNTRDDRWYMSIYEADEPTNTDGGRAAIIDSIPVLADTPMLRLFSDRRRPLGEIVPIDTDARLGAADPGRNDLGSRVVLVYFDNIELQEINIATGWPRPLNPGEQDTP